MKDTTLGEKILIFGCVVFVSGLFLLILDLTWFVLRYLAAIRTHSDGPFEQSMFEISLIPGRIGVACLALGLCSGALGWVIGKTSETP